MHICFVDKTKQQQEKIFLFFYVNWIFSVLFLYGFYIFCLFPTHAQSFPFFLLSFLSWKETQTERPAFNSFEIELNNSGPIEK